MGNLLPIGRSSSSQAVAAYRNFLKLYRRQHSELSPDEAILKAACKWGTLSSDRRKLYEIEGATISEISIKASTVRKRAPAKRPRKGATVNSLKQPKTGVTTRTKPKPKPKSKKTPKPKIDRLAGGKSTPPKRQRTQDQEIKAKKPTKSTKRSKHSNLDKKNAFLGFLTKYREAHKKHSDPRSLKRAARAWCGLTERQRQRFFNMPHLVYK